MPNLDRLASDLTLEKDGKWFTDPWGMGFKFKLARFGKKRFNERVDLLKMEFLEELREDEELPPEESIRIVADAFAFAVLIDWNVTDDDGKAIEYTHERGIEMLMDDRFEEVYDWMFKKSQEKASYLEKVKEAGLGN